MTDLGLWNGEARKHHLSYGQYERAVEHGLLPPPDAVEEESTAEPETPLYRYCRMCGVQYKVGYTKAGKHSQGTLCPACHDAALRKNAKPIIPAGIRICQKCGKQFESTPDVRSNWRNYKICDACREERQHKATHGICDACGKEFPYHITPSGTVSIAKYCPECRAEAAHTKQLRYENDKDHYICAGCGGRFERPLDSQGRRTNRRYCTNCGGGTWERKKKRQKPYTDGYTVHLGGK